MAMSHHLQRSCQGRLTHPRARNPNPVLSRACCTHAYCHVSIPSRPKPTAVGFGRPTTAWERCTRVTAAAALLDAGAEHPEDAFAPNRRIWRLTFGNSDSPSYRREQPGHRATGALAARPESHTAVLSSALVALVLATGVINRLLYKMALVPLKDHIFFLAQLQNLGYLAVYFSALAWRTSTGLVTPAMLSIDKRPLVLVGGCEALAQLLFMVGASRIPGMLLPVVNQTYLVWSLGMAWLLLGTRYKANQLAGAGLVMVGVAAAAVPPAAWAQLLAPLAGAAGPGPAAAAAAGAAVELKYVLVCVACFAFPALSNCIKERVFRGAAQRLGRPLDIFVVNSFGSLAQTFFVLLLLPLTSALNGIPLQQLPAQLAASAHVFMGAHAGPAAGPATPLLALGYVAFNLAFNILMLTLLRSVGSVTTTLVGSSLVPLTIAAFTLPLPFLEPAQLTPGFAVGVVLLMAGLALYNRDALLQRVGGAGSSAATTVRVAAPGGGGSGAAAITSSGDEGDADVHRLAAEGASGGGAGGGSSTSSVDEGAGENGAGGVGPGKALRGAT